MLNTDVPCKSIQMYQINIKHKKNISSCWSWFILIDLDNCGVDVGMKMLTIKPLNLYTDTRKEPIDLELIEPN